MSLPALPLPREWELPLDLLRALATRVPGLRLAVPLDEVEWKRDSVVRGPVELPVAWS